MLGGRPMVAWSLEALATAGLRDVVVAVPQGWTLPGACCVPGGASRSASVRAALAAADPDAELIVVHDAARPLVEPELLHRTLAALADADAAVAAAPVTDTVKEAGVDRVVVRTLDRARLWAVQTPQAFRREALRRALDADTTVLAAATDDAALVEAAGGRVVIVEAPPANFKVTTPHDLRVAGLLLADRARAGA